MKDLMNKKYVEWTFKDALKLSGIILAMYTAIVGLAMGIGYLVDYVQKKKEEKKALEILD